MRSAGAIVGALAVGTATLLAAQSPSRAEPRSTLYEGGRLILGDERAPVESGGMLVTDGRIAAIGRKGGVTLPKNSERVDLTGKTVMPALVNVHAHIGYEGYTSWGAQNYTPTNVLDHLQREAYYGVAVTQSVGSSPTDAAIQFQRDQEAGRFPPASRFFFMPGMAPPNGGPDAILMKGTSVLHAVTEVTTADEARAAVRTMAARNLKNVKIWVDDRRGTYPKMPPAVYEAIISEAHQHGIKVQAHAIAPADQKAVVKAGADVLVHTTQAEKVDEEFLALLREKKPYWTTVIGLGDRSEVCDHDPFIERTYPDSVLAEVRASSACGSPPVNTATREEILAYNITRMIANGARLVLGTDAGITPRHAFGWADHHELSRWVRSGVSPAEAIVAATSRPARLLGLSDAGVLEVGARADFIVLSANPLEDIGNTRAIVNVFLNGAALDRDALAARWKQQR